MGQGVTNPFAAFMSGFGFVLGRPARTLAIEIFFGFIGVLPLLAWAYLGRVWNGGEIADFALILAGQQLVVLLRIVTRVGHLAAASVYIRRSKESVSPALPVRSTSESSLPRSPEESAPAPAAPAL